MSTWTGKVGDATIVIDAGALSSVLEKAGRGRLDGIATRGVAIARAQLAPSDQPFIRAKPARQFPLKSGRLPKLSQMLTIPVALIVNDSTWARQQEYGSTRRRRIRRPLSLAMETLAATGLRMVRGRAA